MLLRWIRRRAHPRHLARGRSINVRESWALRRLEDNRRQHYRHECPHCGAQIISVCMPNSGWAHFEGVAGLGRVKHPCLHIGEGLSTRRDEHTLDLFANFAN